MNIANLDKNKIKTLLLSHIPDLYKGRKPKIAYWRILKMIIYRLKTGTQWRTLPVKAFCGETVVSWQLVYYYFKRWSSAGVFKNIWQALLKTHKECIDLSCAQLDGSHTIAKCGGEAVGYQKRKKAKTSNMLFLVDKKGQILAISLPMAGSHNDLYNIIVNSESMFKDLLNAKIRLNGLFLNADAGFDSQKFRSFCKEYGIIDNFDSNKRNRKTMDNQAFKDEELYKHRFVVERANAWLDAYKALLIRFEKKVNHWMQLHYLAIAIRFVEKK